MSEGLGRCSRDAGGGLQAGGQLRLSVCLGAVQGATAQSMGASAQKTDICASHYVRNTSSAKASSALTS